jgi:hypothetical protein
MGIVVVRDQEDTFRRGFRYTEDVDIFFEGANIDKLTHPSRRTQLQLVNTSPIGVRFEDTGANDVEKWELSSLNAADIEE